MNLSNPLKFGTKAETLLRVEPIIKNARIPNSFFFDVSEYDISPDLIIAKIKQIFKESSIIVRSSSLVEDTEHTSLAGAFDSIGNVNPKDTRKLNKAIEKVIFSMGEEKHNQVLCQEFVECPQISGVLMTYDVAMGSPYYCVEYHDQFQETDRVTGGFGGHKQLCVARGADLNFIKSSRMRSIIKLGRELEIIFNYDALDIEFAVDSDGQVLLFQVRRLILGQDRIDCDPQLFLNDLHKLYSKTIPIFKPSSNLFGKNTLLALMPDWNPAEIIGISPSPLARSLFKHLITSGAWANARALMGYQDLGDTELMHCLNGVPFIDVRASFNSFLPCGLSSNVGNKLIDKWISRLSEHPEFHDKVEFDVACTCLDLSFDKNFNNRYHGILTNEEFDNYRNLLLGLTEHAFVNESSLDDAIIKSKQLEDILFDESKSSKSLSDFVSLKETLNLVKNLGTIPFSVAARHAFICEAILRSAVEEEIFDKELIDLFRASVKNVGGEFVQDHIKAAKDRSFQTEFLRKYGHLRPGTYEITSPRYDEASDLFDNVQTKLQRKEITFSLTDTQRNLLNEKFIECGFKTLNADIFFNHARKAIWAREKIKYIYTKGISDVLQALIPIGAQYRLSREDMSMLDWALINDFSMDFKHSDFIELLIRHIEVNKAQHESELSFKAPYILRSPEDLYCATQSKSQPNFIGSKSTTGKVVVLDNTAINSSNLVGSIVCIPNADPGYDWLFSKNIAGLITCFGGANSHMAVRCSELGVPAVIGCGHRIYDTIKVSNIVEINCKTRIVRVVGEM